MSTRKILFFAILGALLLALVIGLWRLNGSANTKKNGVQGSLSIWIVGDTTEGYQTLVNGFHDFAPEYKNVSIEFRKFSDYASYQKMLLSTLADQKGPDIFMVDADADSVLKDKLELIPPEYINIPDFEKRYDDVFLSLVEASGGLQYLRGVPLGYETLGMFYNKSLLLNPPKTWDEISTMYNDGANPDIFPTNLGLAPRYTPYSSDVVGLFFMQHKLRSYKDIPGNEGIIEDYTAFGHTPIKNTGENGENQESKKLSDLETRLSEEKLTTLDAFMRGDIAFIIGYPSIIKELEDAKKRAGTQATDSLILTERIPQLSLSEDPINIARYKYFGVSKNSQNSLIGVKFLNYLLTEDAQRKFLEAFPTYIPAQISFYESSMSTSLSRVFARTRMNSFIPESNEKLDTFNYGNRSEFDKILWDSIDRNGKIDKSNLKDTLSASLDGSGE